MVHPIHLFIMFAYLPLWICLWQFPEGVGEGGGPPLTSSFTLIWFTPQFVCLSLHHTYLCEFVCGSSLKELWVVDHPWQAPLYPNMVPSSPTSSLFVTPPCMHTSVNLLVALLGTSEYVFTLSTLSAGEALLVFLYNGSLTLYITPP